MVTTPPRRSTETPLRRCPRGHVAAWAAGARGPRRHRFRVASESLPSRFRVAAESLPSRCRVASESLPSEAAAGSGGPARARDQDVMRTPAFFFFFVSLSLSLCFQCVFSAFCIYGAWSGRWGTWSGRDEDRGYGERVLTSGVTKPAVHWPKAGG